MTMTSTESIPQKHDADQAGGAKEVVYSSDGAEQTPIEFPVMRKDEDLVDSAIMTAEQAFEVFAGKLYVANPYSTRQDTTEQEESKESPLQRLGRLKRELEELEKDCASKDDSNLLQDQLAQLQGQLQRLSMTQLKQQESLTATIQASITGLNASEKAEVAQNCSSSTVGVKTELEERVNRLETALGWASGTSSMLDRLEALESMQSKLDDKKLDLLQKRCKVIRQDLEAAAKARNKLVSSTSSAEDSKTIAALYDQLHQLQGMSQHLPALSARLQALAHQHVDAATRAARFQAVEQVTANLQQQVQSMETALTALDASMQQNAAAMLENMKVLEERML
jgi:Dynamitin